MLRTTLTSTTTRTIVASTSRSRAFHFTPLTSKTTTEKVAEVADKVNKKVGRGLASAIEKGEEVTEATKQSLGSASEQTKQSLGNASEQTKQAAGQAGQKANQAAAGAREAKDDAKADLEKQLRK